MGCPRIGVVPAQHADLAPEADRRPGYEGGTEAEGDETDDAVEAAELESNRPGDTDAVEGRVDLQAEPGLRSHVDEGAPVGRLAEVRLLIPGQGWLLATTATSGSSASR